MKEHLKILFVDDNKNLVHSMAIGLSKQGIETQGVSDSVEALELLTRDEYSILISDISMPKMNGALLAQVAKRISPELKIILVTAYDFDDYEKDYPEIKPFVKLNKPFDVKQLLALINHSPHNIFKSIERSLSWDNSNFYSSFYL
ncbi:MAG: response regulator [candidate division KSB1 bacterium]|nr:response regulator [candidate division KSB1 bacterium]